jgi:RPE1 domain-containing protein
MACVPYVLTQIPYGVITDRIGAKIIVAVGYAMCAVGVLIFGMATSVFQLELGRFIIGFFSASAYLCCGKVTNIYFSKQKYALLMGWAAGIGSLGSMLGTTPISLLTHHIGWRNTTYIMAALGICLSIITFIIMPADKKANKSNGSRFLSKPPESDLMEGDTEHRTAVYFDVHEDSSTVSTSQKTDYEEFRERSGADLFNGLKILIKNPRSWLLGVYGAILFLPLSALAELWMIPFMEVRFGVSTERASFGSVALFLGFTGGNLLSSWIAEKIDSCKKVMIVCSIVFTLALWRAIFSDSIDYNTCLMLLLITGIMAGSNIFSFSLAYNMVPEKYGGTSVGFINAVIMLSGVIFQPLLGKLLDLFRNGMVDGGGHPVYTVEIYRHAFTSIIIGAVLAVCSTFFVEDSKHRG